MIDATNNPNANDQTGVPSTGNVSSGVKNLTQDVAQTGQRHSQQMKNFGKNTICVGFHGVAP
jgi:hypothetical protein